MVDTNDFLAEIRGLIGRGVVIRPGRIVGRQEITGLDVGRGIRVDHARRDDIVRELLARLQPGGNDLRVKGRTRSDQRRKDLIWRSVRQKGGFVAAQLCRRQHLVVDAAAVDLAAPFLVVEEEGLGLARPELHRPAAVESEGVVTELRLPGIRGIRLLLIVVPGIQRIVAVIFPSAGVEPLRAALDSHGGHAARAVALVGREVARLDGEFRKRIFRRCYYKNAAAAAIVSLAAVDDPVVAVGTHAVEVDRSALELRAGRVEVRHLR